MPTITLNPAHTKLANVTAVSMSSHQYAAGT
jgi:hypothetical protein